MAITGATGVVYGIRILEVLRHLGIESHLIVSKWGARTLAHETKFSLADVQELADHVHAPGDQGAPLSSGSFLVNGMVIAPCSVRTLGAIASGHGDNLIHRAADVTLKESRKLVLVVREAPFHQIHLENMLRLSRMGAVIFPPAPAFYHRPGTIEDLIDHTVGRVLDQMGVHTDLMPRWDGRMVIGGHTARDKTENATPAQGNRSS